MQCLIAVAEPRSFSGLLSVIPRESHFEVIGNSRWPILMLKHLLLLDGPNRHASEWAGPVGVSAEGRPFNLAAEMVSLACAGGGFPDLPSTPCKPATGLPQFETEPTGAVLKKQSYAPRFFPTTVLAVCRGFQKRTLAFLHPPVSFPLIPGKTAECGGLRVPYPKAVPRRGAQRL